MARQIRKFDPNVIPPTPSLEIKGDDPLCMGADPIDLMANELGLTPKELVACGIRLARMPVELELERAYGVVDQDLPMLVFVGDKRKNPARPIASLIVGPVMLKGVMYGAVHVSVNPYAMCVTFDRMYGPSSRTHICTFPLRFATCR